MTPCGRGSVRSFEESARCYTARVSKRSLAIDGNFAPESNEQAVLRILQLPLQPAMAYREAAGTAASFASFPEGRNAAINQRLRIWR